LRNGGRPFRLRKAPEIAILAPGALIGAHYP